MQLFLFSDRRKPESCFENAIEGKRKVDSVDVFRVRTAECTVYIKLEPNTIPQNRSTIISGSQMVNIDHIEGCNNRV